MRNLRVREATIPCKLRHACVPEATIPRKLQRIRAPEPRSLTKDVEEPEDRPSRAILPNVASSGPQSFQEGLQCTACGGKFNMQHRVFYNII